MNPPLPRDVALLLVLALLVVLALQVMWLTGGRDRLARIGEALTLFGRVADRPSALRSPERAVVPVPDRQLEDALAAAKSEIERLRARLAQLSRNQTSATQTRAEEIATTARQRRLWIARGGHRQSQTNR